jgi:prevent-host-death family protein
MESAAKASVGIYELKTHLSSVLDRVSAGETVTVTRHSTPIAYITPATAGSRTPAEAASSLRLSRPGRSLAGTSLRELIDEGRKH